VAAVGHELKASIEFPCERSTTLRRGHAVCGTADDQGFAVDLAGSAPIIAGREVAMEDSRITVLE